MSGRLMVCIALAMLLVGCNKAGSGDSSGISGGISGTGDGGSYESGTTPLVSHNPEPVTTALVGGGLIAYAVMQRKKKNRS